MYRNTARELNEIDPEGLVKLLGGAVVGTPAQIEAAIMGETITDGDPHIISREQAIDVAASLAAPAMQSAVEAHLNQPHGNQ